jgi:hypothetical protein
MTPRSALFMGTYNTCMNGRLYAAAQRLSPA